MAQMVKRLSTMWETQVRSLGWEDPLEKEVTIHSSATAWEIPWTEKPGRLQSMGFSRQEYWSGLPFPSPRDLSQPRDRTWVSHIIDRRFTVRATREDISDIKLIRTDTTLDLSQKAEKRPL